MEEQERIKITNSFHEEATIVMGSDDDFTVIGSQATSVWWHGMTLLLTAF